MNFPNNSADDPYRVQRQQMVLRDISSKTKDGRTPIKDPVILEAMKTVPRHYFVSMAWMAQAYDDIPLPIDYGQTISQPYIVALMTELLQLRKDDVVLEIGTGSGYQTAILAEIAHHVYSIEIIPELGKIAKQRLQNLGYQNITFHIKDGYQGLGENAPYDAIIVTAAADDIPPRLIEQLKPGRHIVIPVKIPSQSQLLKRITKKQDGCFDKENIIPVSFVPLTRKP